MPPNLSKDDRSVRTFLAIELPSEVRTALAAIVGDLAGFGRALKPVGAENMHLTVRFLGEVAPGRVDAIARAAHQAAAASSPFTLTLDHIGSFGGAMPRVIWAGLVRDDGYTALQHLYARVGDALAASGFSREERPYAPHLTLARVREGLDRATARELGVAIRRLREERPLCGSFEVPRLVAMRSDLGPGGPRYTALAGAPLPGTQKEEA